jgi:TetR/AcrR family transcriptional regulator, transcriptional repressor of bet genes
MGRRDLSDERKPQIIDAAKRAIARHGIEGATQERIAEEAGMSRPHIRHYLGNRDEVLDAVWEATMRRYVEGMDRVAAEAATPDGVRSALETFLESSFVYEEDDIVVHSFVGEARRDERVRERTVATYDRVERTVRDLIRRLDPTRSDAEVESLAHGLNALTMGAMMLDLLRPDEPRADRLIDLARALVERSATTD